MSTYMINQDESVIKEIDNIKNKIEKLENEDKTNIFKYTQDEQNQKINKEESIKEIENPPNSGNHLILDVSHNFPNETKINNITNNLSSINEDELFAHLNKEAEKIQDKITNKELNIFNKYDKLKEEEIKVLLKEKNKEILLMSKDQEKHKDDLSKMIEKLNEAIDRSTAILLKKEKNPQNMKSLENILDVRKKELNNTKNQIKIYRQQYEIVNAKANDRFSNEKINEMEEQIDKTKKENLDLQKKVRILRNSQVKHGKELEVLNRNKKYPQKINSQTDDVKILISKKHEYFTKLNNNKKSLINLKNYLFRIQKMLSDTQNNPKYYHRLNENIIRQIEEEMNKISEEIKGNEEEILERICNREIENNNIYNNNILLRNPIRQEKQILFEKSKSPKNKNIQNILPKILNNRLQIINKKEYKGIFNKYEYLNSKNKPIKDIKKNKLILQNKSDIEENSHENSSEILKDEEVISLDYENTYDIDFVNLHKKKDQLENINNKIEKNIKEIEKLYDKKFKDLMNTIDHNQKKLKLMEQQNELLSVEMGDLTKIIKLNLEENLLKKEIKDSESRIFKNNVPTNIMTTHPDASETRNEILQDLNNIFIAEGENQKSNKVKEKVGSKDLVIEEENPEDSSYLQDNVVAETNENKNLKFPDISNVEVVEEDVETNRRDKRLNNIKNKYINIGGKDKINLSGSLDNEINFYERNL